MTVQPPSANIVRACDALEDLIGAVIAAKGQRARTFGQFEAPVEAEVLLRLVIRHVEAIIALARSDLVLVPSAEVLNRAALETSLRIVWMLHPDDDFAREARWLAHLQEEERLWERMFRVSRETGDAVGDYASWAQRIFSFRAAVGAKLKEHCTVIAHIPSSRDILKEQGDERRYLSYALLSQTVHGGHFAGSAFRRGLGTSKVIHERSFGREWPLQFRIAWWSLNRAAVRYVKVVCLPGVQLGRPEQHHELEDALIAAEADANGVGLE